MVVTVLINLQDQRDNITLISNRGLSLSNINSLFIGKEVWLSFLPALMRGRPSAQCYRSLGTTLESHFISCAIPCTSVTYPPSDSHGQCKLCHLWQGASAAICHTMRLFSALLCLSSSSRRSWSKKLSMFADCLEENSKCILQVKAKPGILKHIGSIFNIFLLTLQGETA